MNSSTGWDSALFAARLKEIIGEDSVSRFAKRCDFAESMLRKYLLGDSVPGADKLVRIAQATGVSLRWLATGEGAQSDAAGWDRVTPSQLAVVLEFERYARMRADTGTRTAIRIFVSEYNEGLLEIGTIGDITQIKEDELILWRDLAWERRVEKAAIDEKGLCMAIEIAYELMETSGKAMDPEKKARLIVAIYRLNATTEGGLDRSMLMNLLVMIS
ncbi:MAG: helix-turn-helix transcriptional regulator [gamma proteobacterium endosymbiont of Lamellibrachia anaximandri]|nr:helix-turn-helix transcriptional regulator [gamma proteobacterium endosymbiont of Lamellibrachia anaximandri]